MSGNPKTVLDIVAGMERDAERGYPMTPDICKRLCKQLSEAAKLEYQFLDAAKKVGNAARLREALLRVLGAFYDGCDNKKRAKLDQEDFDAITEALAAPPRNCDVGTALDQSSRWRAYCNRMMKQNNHCCGPCPCYKWVNGEVIGCGNVWGQLPYEEGGAQ